MEAHPPPGDTGPLVRSKLLANPRHRHLLLLLLKSDPLTERDLAIQLAALEQEDSPSEVANDVRRQIRMDLHHRGLPMLEAVGWIERGPEGIVVTEQLFAETPGLSLLEFEDLDHSSWEALTTLLARPRRQYMASIIVDHSEPLTLNELGTGLVATDQTPLGSNDRTEEPTLLTTLHHVDLPKLDEVELIEYHSETKTIRGNELLTELVDRLDISPRQAKDTEVEF